MTSHFIPYRQSTIHYRKSGKGQHLVVCFHGFGEFAKTFDPIAASLTDHTLIAIDLPFHGETIWREGLECSIEEMLEIIRLCPEIGEKPYGLMGYSMGGRIVLSIYEAIPDKISYIVLIAPDGLKVNPMVLVCHTNLNGKTHFQLYHEKPCLVQWLASGWSKKRLCQ